MLMPVAKPATTKPAITKTAISQKTISKNQSLYSSMQSRFATSSLISNLGSSNNGISFVFVSNLRTAYGRD